MPDTKQPEQKFYSSPKLPLNSIPGIPENINIPPQLKRLDYSEFRDDANDVSWHTLYDEGIDYGKQIESVFKSCVYLQNPSLQYPLLTAYALTPSALCKALPLLLIEGFPGTGKSLIGIIISKLRGEKILSSADTFASLRNEIEERRYCYGMERNYILIWDDIDPGVLKTNPDLYRLLKLGYNRSTSTITIASAKQGQNVQFNVFGPKVASTIHSAIYTLPEFSELRRRLLLIKSSKVPEYNPVDLYDPQFINWSDSPRIYEEFWGDEVNVIEFVKFQKELRKSKPRHIASDNYLLYISLGATMIVTGLMANKKEVINFFSEYDNHRRIMIESNKNNLYALLKDYVLECQIKHEKLEMELGESIPFTITPKTLDVQILMAHSQGLLDVNPNLELKKESMRELGFKLTLEGWVKHDVN